ncbi:MAG TPA: hypothetical protein VHY37_09930 [Tepidisphaeraceae bacterium]|nr:hypothetical protein [Tepidisphaeraceae bacterium]
MPRLTRSIPKYRKHRASGQAIVTLNGRDYYLGPHGTAASRREYDRLTAEWMANGRTMPDPECRKLVGDITLSFWNHAKTYYRDVDGNETDEQENFRHALRFLKPYATLPVDEFTPSKLRAIQHTMMQSRTVTDPKTKKTATRPGWARKHINRRINRIRHVFQWAVSQEMIPATVHIALKTVEPLKWGRTEARETAPVRPVEEQMVDQVLAAMPTAVRALVELQELTGARGGELRKLRTVDIDTSPTSPAARSTCAVCKPNRPCPMHSVWL